LADQRASAVAIRAVHYCRAAIGTPYVWGGESTNGYDCSGLCFAAYSSAGKPIPRTSQTQYAAGFMDVSWGKWAPGDLIFSQWPGDGSSPGHVVIYEGAGTCIAAPHTGTTVQREPASTFGGSHYVGSVRPAPLKGARSQVDAVGSQVTGTPPVPAAGIAAVGIVPVLMIGGLAVVAVGGVILFKSHPGQAVG
jgi:hypothetical protein